MKKEWTPELRELLFEILGRHYGPYATWRHPHYPSAEKRAEYEDFLAIFEKDYEVTGAAYQVYLTTLDEKRLLPWAAADQDT